MDIASDIAVRFGPEVLASLGDYIAIPALSPHFDSDWKRTGAIDMAAQHLFAWAMGRDIQGLRGSIREIDGHTPVIVLEIDGTDGVDQPGSVLLYGHLDKQPPLGDWSEGLSPFQAVRRDDLLYSVMGNPMVAWWYSLKRPKNREAPIFAPTSMP